MPVCLLRRMPLLDKSLLIGRGRTATQGQVVGCVPEEFPSAPRSPGGDIDGMWLLSRILLDPM